MSPCGGETHFARDFSFFNFRDAQNGMACADNASRLYDIERYVQGLKALRKDQPDMVLFAAITGVPPDLVQDPSHIDYDAILNDSRMEVRSDGQVRAYPVAACSFENVGDAVPARRIVQVAQAFGENGLVQSICNANYLGALSALQGKTADIISGPCLPRKLIADANGRVECDVIETLPLGRRCDEVPGRKKARDVDGHEVCRVQQVGASEASAGWYYDADVNAQHCEERAGSIRYTEGAQSLRGSHTDLECIEPVQLNRAEVENAGAIGLECDDNASCQAHEDPKQPNPVKLFCEMQSRTCQASCAEDANCPATMVCDTARASPACVNPTCPR